MRIWNPPNSTNTEHHLQFQPQYSMAQNRWNEFNGHEYMDDRLFWIWISVKSKRVFSIVVSSYISNMFSYGKEIRMDNVRFILS